MNYRLSSLKNGVRVLTVTLPKMESATLTVWLGVGSRYEAPKISGISHFLEHMVFKGSKKRPSAKLIAEAIDSIGAEFNASTSKEWTDFYIKARAGVIETAFDVLSDMVLNPLLVKEEIEREKGVIVEEIGMYEDTPVARIGDVFEQLIFLGSSLGRDIIGTAKTVKGITRDDFEAYRKKYYFSRNILITASGGIEHNQIVSLSEKYFGKVKKGSAKSYKKFERKQKGPQILLHPKKKEQAHFILGFLGNPKGQKDRFDESIVAAIMGGGMSSRLFSEVRERRGLAYAVRANVDHYQDTGYFAAYVGVDVKRVDEAIKVVIDQCLGLADEKFPLRAEEIRKAKEYLKGHLALSLEDTKAVNHFFGEEELLLGKVRTPEDVYKRIDAVGKDDILRVAKKLFVPKNLNLAIIGPYKSQSRFERLVS